MNRHCEHCDQIYLAGDDIGLDAGLKSVGEKSAAT